jgi:hypothetical protein
MIINLTNESIMFTSMFEKYISMLAYVLSLLIYQALAI